MINKIALPMQKQDKPFYSNSQTETNKILSKSTILSSWNFFIVKYLLEHVHKSRQKYKNDLDISYYRTNLYYRRFNQVSGHAIAHWFIIKKFEP